MAAGHRSLSGSQRDLFPHYFAPRAHRLLNSAILSARRTARPSLSPHRHHDLLRPNWCILKLLQRDIRACPPMTLTAPHFARQLDETAVGRPALLVTIRASIQMWVYEAFMPLTDSCLGRERMHRQLSKLQRDVVLVVCLVLRTDHTDLSTPPRWGSQQAQLTLLRRLVKALHTLSTHSHLL